MAFSKMITVFVLTGFFAYADSIPTIHQVYETAKSGNLSGAHQMVEQVLKAHPESSKAHYIDAEILLRQGNLSEAKAELAKAEQLDPGLSFAKPQAVQSLKQHLQSSSNIQMNSNPIGSIQSSVPWTMLLLGFGALLFIWLVIRAFSSRNANYPMRFYGADNVGNNAYPNNPYGPTYSQQSSGLGSGIMSGLATGAAAGVGFVAGEELMRHFIDGPSTNTHDNFNTTPIVNDESSYDMGGNDFGVEDNSSWDDNSSDAISDSGSDTW